MPQSDKTVDQGSPNTPANAWPVSVTNFPSNSYFVKPVGHEELPITIPPHTNLSIEFDTSNFTQAYVWVRFLNHDIHDLFQVSVVSQMDVGPILSPMEFLEEVFFINGSDGAVVKHVNTRGSSTRITFAIPINMNPNDTHEVAVAMKVIG